MEILEEAMNKLGTTAYTKSGHPTIHPNEAHALLDHIMELRSDVLELTDQLVKARETALGVRQIAADVEVALERQKERQARERELLKKLLPKGE